MTRGIRNNNPLNLRISNNSWLGKITPNTDGDFEQFDTIEHGIRAAFINMRTHLKQDKCRLVRTTIAREIERWAPASENNTVAYINSVCNKANFLPNDLLSFENKNVMCRLLWAMSYVENGITIPFHLFEREYALL